MIAYVGCQGRTLWRSDDFLSNFRFHHVGITVRDLQTAIPAYQELFDYRVISGPFDDPIQNISVLSESRRQRPRHRTGGTAWARFSHQLRTQKKAPAPITCVIRSRI